MLSPKKIITTAIATTVFIFLLAFLVPTKFCLSSIPTNEGELYIITYSRSKNRWLVIGDKTGLFTESSETEYIADLVIINTFWQFAPISVDLYTYDNSTNFIIYGTAVVDDYWDERYDETILVTRYTIECVEWDILGKIETSNSFRSIFPRNYLNIYDWRWFDICRDRLYGFLDGQSRF